MVTTHRWLILLVGLPPTPSRVRVGVWRKLKRLGAVTIGSAWLLPDTPETLEQFQWLVQEVRAAKGTATLIRAERIETMTDAEILALFEKRAAPEYERLQTECRELLARLDRLGAADRAGVERWRARLDRLRVELDRVRRTDHADSALGRRVATLLETAAARVRAAEAGSVPRAARGKAGALPPPGSTWVTRPRPHVDRVASAWLIKRFIDRDATFAFADAADTAKKGVPFDVLGAAFGHRGDDCTFETLMKRFRLTDRRLRAIAEIVHEADLKDGKYVRAEAAGLDVALRALLAAIPDDHEVLERGMAVFDGLYAMLKRDGRSPPRR
ncbi:MAG: chromate resistance protein [Candidatus Rokubacteria bacterium]|nr:chromate resistance protein [Candidatus Rokubacteria bacterium]